MRAFCSIALVALAIAVFLWLDNAGPQEIDGVVVGRHIETHVDARWRTTTLRLVEVRDERGVHIVDARNCLWTWNLSAHENYAALTPGQHVHLKVAGPRIAGSRYFPRVRQVDVLPGSSP